MIILCCGYYEAIDGSGAIHGGAIARARKTFLVNLAMSQGTEVSKRRNELFSNQLRQFAAIWLSLLVVEGASAVCTSPTDFGESCTDYDLVELCFAR
jgi:hypothetical protein